MLRKTKEWDVRLPKALAKMFPRTSRKGYYYKVDREQARRICRYLSAEYRIREPLVTNEQPKGCNGWCEYRYQANGERFSRIAVHARGHIKTVFHEWYHHLDHMTGGRYNSSDRLQLAWRFADRLFDLLRKS